LGLLVRLLYYQWKCISNALTLHELQNTGSCSYLSLGGGNFYNPFARRSQLENVKAFLFSHQNWRTVFSVDPAAAV